MCARNRNTDFPFKDLRWVRHTRVFNEVGSRIRYFRDAKCERLVVMSDSPLKRFEILADQRRRVPSFGVNDRAY